MDVPTSVQSLASLLDNSLRHTKVIGLQAPEANLYTIFFGDKNSQPLELRPSSNASLPVTSFRELYVVGTSPDKLSIVLFDGA